MTEFLKNFIIEQNSFNKKSKNVAILFTGGLDSATLLDYAVSMGHNIQLIYTEILNNETKTKRETISIDKIVQYYKNVLNYDKLTLYKNQIHLDVHYDNYKVMFSQIPINILSSLSFRRDTDEVWFGYAMSDQAISYIDVLKKIFNSYKIIWDVDKFPKLLFPLTKVSKGYSVDGIDRNVLPFITFCESGYELEEHKRCGTCDACRRYDYEFTTQPPNEFAHFYGTPPKENYKDVSKGYLKKVEATYWREPEEGNWGETTYDEEPEYEYELQKQQKYNEPYHG